MFNWYNYILHSEYLSIHAITLDKFFSIEASYLILGMKGGEKYGYNYATTPV